MHVKDINVVCPQFFQAIHDGCMHALRQVPSNIVLQWPFLLIIRPIVSRKFRCDNHLTPNSALFRPFADKPFRFLRIMSVGCIDEVPAERVISVEESKGSSFWPKSSLHEFLMLMPPRAIWETLTAAVDDKMRW